MKAYYQNGEPVESSKLDYLIDYIYEAGKTGNLGFQAKPQILALIEEVIGPEDTEQPLNHNAEIALEARQGLRAEQRRRKEAL